jgi:hypothetical protein
MEEIQTSDFIKTQAPERINKNDEYESIWNGLTIDEDIFDDYKGLYVLGNPSSEIEYEKGIDDAIKLFMEKSNLGETVDSRSEESVKKFLVTPIGNGNIKKGYILLQDLIVSENERGVKEIIEYHIQLKITSEISFTYGMILIAYSYGIKTCDLGYFYPTGAKVGISDDHFVFELYDR